MDNDHLLYLRSRDTENQARVASWRQDVGDRDSGITCFTSCPNDAPTHPPRPIRSASNSSLQSSLMGFSTAADSIPVALERIRRNRETTAHSQGVSGPMIQRPQAGGIQTGPTNFSLTTDELPPGSSDVGCAIHDQDDAYPWTYPQWVGAQGKNKRTGSPIQPTIEANSPRLSPLYTDGSPIFSQVPPPSPSADTAAKSPALHSAHYTLPPASDTPSAHSSQQTDPEPAAGPSVNTTSAPAPASENKSSTGRLTLRLSGTGSFKVCLQANGYSCTRKGAGAKVEFDGAGLLDLSLSLQ